MNPQDLVGVLRRGLDRDRRPPDGLLHCSGDLLGPLRHSQLRLAGAPMIEDALVSAIRLRTGTMWHDHFRDLFVREGLAAMGEVRLDRWLPTGWSGTADWLFWDFDKRAFRLGDLKTTKGSGIQWVERDGIKPEHRYQLSAYYHALKVARVPLVRAPFVCYLPMDKDPDRDTEPVLIEFEPVPKDELWALMDERWNACQEYLMAIDDERERFALETGQHPMDYPTDDDVLNDKLAPPADRVQKLFFDRKNDQWDVKLVPDWRTRFCPFPNELCDCSTQGSTKIGHYKDGEYVPRKGYENVIPLLRPAGLKVAA